MFPGFPQTPVTQIMIPEDVILFLLILDNVYIFERG